MKALYYTSRNTKVFKYNLKNRLFFSLINQNTDKLRLNMLILDAIDKKILDILQNDARISNTELAERVNLSPTPCARRVRQLTDEGYIRRHITLLDQKKVGLGVSVFVSISLDRHTNERFNEFEEAVKKMPQVVSCSVITGRSEDYLLKVVATDMTAYKDFLLNELNCIPGIINVHTSLELRNVIDCNPLPIP